MSVHANLRGMSHYTYVALTTREESLSLIINSATFACTVCAIQSQDPQCIFAQVVNIPRTAVPCSHDVVCQYYCMLVYRYSVDQSGAGKNTNKKLNDVR